ncbi:MAG: GNAT family N-acetyltransferase [Bacteroidetes bacterium]|nr:GNAT family N-acetyltransferase [Bacteroidota bacterium]
MRISKYGIILSTLKEEDIELVRIKRNSDMIKSTMHFQEAISPEMQKAWFENIKSAIYKNESPSFYFIINYENEKIGLINGKNIDLNAQSSEGGFFIWESKYWGTLVPVMTSIITLDYTFLLNDFKENYIKVLKSNTNAIFYNKQLGYEAIEKYSEDNQSQYYVLTKENYLKNSGKFRKSIGGITNDFEPLSLSDLDFNDTGDEELIKVLPLLKEFQKQQVLKILKLNNRIIFFD